MSADFVVQLTGMKAEGLLVDKMKPKRMSRIRSIGCNFPQLRNNVGIRLRTRGDDFQHHAKALSAGIGSSIEWKVRVLVILVLSSLLLPASGFLFKSSTIEYSSLCCVCYTLLHVAKVV